jgi:hypothetical protein
MDLTIWPSERTASLRRLIREGLTDREIAARLDLSLRAVVGKRQRLHLAANPPPRGRHAPADEIEKVAP